MKRNCRMKCMVREIVALKLEVMKIVSANSINANQHHYTQYAMRIERCQEFRITKNFAFAFAQYWVVKELHIFVHQIPITLHITFYTFWWPGSICTIAHMQCNLLNYHIALSFFLSFFLHFLLSFSRSLHFAKDEAKKTKQRKIYACTFCKII